MKLRILSSEIGPYLADSDPRLQLQTDCFAVSCRNQRRQVPVKVPVKSKPGYYTSKTPAVLGNHWK